MSTVPNLVASSGIPFRLWRMYAQFWLVCLVFPILFLLQGTTASPSLAVAGLLLYVAIYTWFMWPHPLEADMRGRSYLQATVILLIVLTGLTLWLSLVYGSSFLWLFVGLSAVAGVALSARSAFVAVMVLTLTTLGLGIGLSGGLASTDWLQLVPLVLLVRGVGLDITGLVRLADALRELHLTRGELARQAVTEERLRLARDLHDLLGHSLSLITLKSELAGRLIEREPTRAVQEVREVEQAARQALREVREAVAGYRQPTLHGELDGARQMLEAAGITCAIEQTTNPLAAPTDSVLAWAVREGVTNVIRHSRARQCTIRVGRNDGKAYAEVINDGYEEGERKPKPAETGNGLSGLTERVTSRGGCIEAGPLGDEPKSHFRLWVEVPTLDREMVEQERWS